MMKDPDYYKELLKKKLGKNFSFENNLSLLGLFLDSSDFDPEQETNRVDTTEFEEYETNILTHWKGVYVHLNPRHRQKMTERLISKIRKTYRNW